MMYTQAIVFFFLVGALTYQPGMTAPQESMVLNKVFNYQGPMPIKDDKTGEVILGKNQTAIRPPAELAAAEAACWKLINEQSGK